MSNFIGKWWITIWSSKNKEITIGVGESFPATSNSVFNVKEYRLGSFYIYITTPTIMFLNNR
jgi:hypothetical protein